MANLISRFAKEMPNWHYIRKGSFLISGQILEFAPKPIDVAPR